MIVTWKKNTNSPAPFADFASDQIYSAERVSSVGKTHKDKFDPYLSNNKNLVV